MFILAEAQLFFTAFQRFCNFFLDFFQCFPTGFRDADAKPKLHPVRLLFLPVFPVHMVRNPVQSCQDCVFFPVFNQKAKCTAMDSGNRFCVTQAGFDDSIKALQGLSGFLPAESMDHLAIITDLHHNHSILQILTGQKLSALFLQANVVQTSGHLVRMYTTFNPPQPASGKSQQKQKTYKQEYDQAAQNRNYRSAIHMIHHT